ncbi:YggT family protein [Brachybacterium halotolerans subsp. kimchii]|uniref:YggT family protein n=2 Tax=Brachybacterium TaxID=43668 RepID=A0ABS1B7B0_9MICO|nr:MULTISPECIES: YggT family protein [Brachybacterium]MBK0330509.1 YggT family protein [Brachybacterium halotolerans]MCG7311032.1 YggT family protein [Brachybacterium sp. ACRRE]UEJ83647.1 YggT family protein [Brachybacterium halotolerans subsp. kimchii]UQN31237.1 YggT family protein [Brachybacterium kimchii]
MQLIASILYLALLLYTLVLLARLVLDWIRSYARDFRPRGIVLLLFEIVFTLTDPPVRALRRVIPPLRLGSFSLDLSLLILLLVCSLLMRVLWGIAI